MSRTDRRIRRTQAALQKAMVELVVEQGLEATTVQQIVDRADVGRSTFYTHYADKEDLLQGSISALHTRLKELLADTDTAADLPPALRFVRPMLTHADSHRAIFAALSTDRAGPFAIDLFHDLWCDLIQDAWPDADEVAVQAVAGAFGGVLHWWMRAGRHLTQAELELRLVRALAPMVPSG